MDPLATLGLAAIAAIVAALIVALAPTSTEPKHYFGEGRAFYLVRDGAVVSELEPAAATYPNMVMPATPIPQGQPMMP